MSIWWGFSRQRKVEVEFIIDIRAAVLKPSEMLDLKRALPASSSVYIILSTFDGATHLREQVESISKQSNSDWRLLIRDDQSSDGTDNLLKELAVKDDRIEVLQDELGHLGSNESFSRLMEAALSRGADWIAISDQDDVWKPDKLDLQLARLAAVGARPDEEVLIHSDLMVVGSRLEAISPSLHRAMKLRHEDHSPLATLLLQNFVTGCTCIASRALLERALPIPEEAIVYDWWLALCAGSMGRIVFEPASTVLYRQHSQNQIGFKPYRRALGGLLAHLLKPHQIGVDEIMDTIKQAHALELHLANLLGDCEKDGSEGRSDSRRLNLAHDFLAEYIGLYRKGHGRARRVCGLARLRVRRQDPILDAALKLKLLFVPVECSFEAPST